MSSKLAICAAVAALPFLIAAMPVQTAAKDIPPVDARNAAEAKGGNAVSGQELFNMTCKGCHGVNGKELAGRKPEELLAAMKRYQEMTSFESPKVQAMHKALTGMNLQDLEDLAAYMSTMDKFERDRN